MYGKQRPLDTTIYAVRARGLRYYVDIDPRKRAQVKSIAFKSECFLKTLASKDKRFFLQLNPNDLKQIKSPYNYSFVITLKDGKQEIVNGVIIIVR